MRSYLNSKDHIYNTWMVFSLEWKQELNVFPMRDSRIAKKCINTVLMKSSRDKNR